jgi:hypothetical protein
MSLRIVLEWSVGPWGRWASAREVVAIVGVEAHQFDSHLAGLGGDSGSLAFALIGSNSRQARDIASAR